MDPSTLITMFFLGILLLIILAIVSYIFRKNKRIAFSSAAFLGTTYILFFALQPIVERHEHANRYDTLTSYLQKTYPTLEFEIQSKTLEEGMYPYEYFVYANDYRYRGEIFRVDSDGIIHQNSYTTESYLGYDELDTLIQMHAASEPFDYLLNVPEYKRIASYEQDDFIAYAVEMNGEIMLWIVEIIDGQYFLAQGLTADNGNNYIKTTVSTNHATRYSVLLTLPGFDENSWQQDYEADLNFTQPPPSIYVVE